MELTARSKAKNRRASSKKKGNIRSTPRLAAEKRRRLILDEARDLFVRRGYHGTRTKELAEVAGITEATLYSYFSSKKELFEESITKPVEAHYKAIRQRDIKEFKRRNFAFDREFLVAAQQEGIDALNDIFPLLTTTLFSDFENGKEFYNSLIYKRVIKPYSDISIKQGLVKSRSRAELIIVLAVGMQMAVAMDEHFRGVKHDHLDVAKLITDLLDFASSQA